ncbi:MAG TPA: hydrogenase iron-sulfur subunit, partial [Methanomassiliicoccales archaeon]|nr:hydrogenase iron-sulfur subunit [Methanomassiliicoccales archaeon]
TVDTPLGETDLECGALLLAMDTEAARNPLADLFGEDCIDQDGLEQRLRQGMRPKGRLVMLAMDASGESAFDPMSTHEAVHNALFVKGVSPNCEVSIITREIFALGQCEAGYRKAQGSGVRIVRTDRMPGRDGPDTLRVHDVHLGQDILLRYDLMVLDNATTIPDMISMCKVIGLPCDLQGRPSRPNAKLLPSSSQREGVYLCGTAIERSLGIGPTLQAKASAAKMSAMLRSPIHRNGDVAQVYSEKCSACLTCVRSCPYSAPYMNPENKAAVNEDLCQGCGLCVSLCPSKALQQLSYRDDQMEAQIEMALGGSVMKVIAFTCSYCGYSAADLAGLEGREYSADVIINRLPCTGRLEQRHVLRAFREGADGVLVFGCLEGNCNFHYGNIEARKRVTAVRELMSMLGLGPERLEMCNVASNQSFRFVEIVEEMEKRLERIGPSPVNKVRS